jgi:hypothetical protein
VKREVALSIRDRAHHGKPGVLVEQVVAHHQRRTATFLLVPRLGIERDRDVIALAGNLSFV